MAASSSNLVTRHPLPSDRLALSRRHASVFGGVRGDGGSLSDVGHHCRAEWTQGRWRHRHRPSTSGSGCPSHRRQSQHGGCVQGVADGVTVVVVVRKRDRRRRPSWG